MVQWQFNFSLHFIPYQIMSNGHRISFIYSFHPSSYLFQILYKRRGNSIASPSLTHKEKGTIVVTIIVLQIVLNTSEVIFKERKNAFIQWRGVYCHDTLTVPFRKCLPDPYPYQLLEWCFSNTLNSVSISLFSRAIRPFINPQTRLQICISMSSCRITVCE